MSIYPCDVTHTGHPGPFINEPKIGDYVLVHAGCAIQKIDEDYAIETLKIFKELSEAIKECKNNGNA